ncbi:MAG TPA: hypothetical protein VMC09_02210 [Anaerolineales bacterium]|nr:hypothetical protein [Anaerolineales bacterium]
MNWKKAGVVFLIAIYLLILVFRIGGNNFVVSVNDNLAIPLALGVTLLALLMWRQPVVGDQNRLLWLGLTVGWLFWTIAEFWWGFASLLGQNVPYPSWADFFWLVGYIPMFVALLTRVRRLPQRISSMQTAGILASILVSLGATIFFVLIPIIRENDPAAVLESILNILYPVVDLVLLILVFQILFVYQQGMYGRAWGWLSAGFLLHSLSNLLFSFTTTANLYNPGGQVNLLFNILVDVPYNLGYLFWLIGLFIVRDVQLIHRAYPVTDDAGTLNLIPNTHILVFTKADDTVVNVSRNFTVVFPIETVDGKSIKEILGIPPDEAESLLRTLKANKLLKEKDIFVTSRWGQKQAWVSGVIVNDPQEEYSGVILLLRMYHEDYSLDGYLTDYQRGEVNSLLSVTGTRQKVEEDIKQLLLQYYLAFIKRFYNRMLAEGGGIMADAFLTELQSVASQHGWQVAIHPESLLDLTTLTLSRTQTALPTLFDAARQFVARITNDATTEQIVQDVRLQFSEPILKNISHFERADLLFYLQESGEPLPNTGVSHTQLIQANKHP